MLTRRQLAGDAWANLRFRLRGSTDEATEQLKRRILEAIAGQRVVDLARLGPEVLAGILPMLYREVLREAYAHQDAGRRVYIVTAASQELADVLARVLVLDGGIGMRSEVINGVYTGRAAGPITYREGKAEAIRELAEREGIDLAESYAYSDSESDLPMLRAVGHPIAVNPDSALGRVARESGWRIMRFDKLGRRLKVGAAVGGVALVGGGGGYMAARLRPRSGRRRGRRPLPTRYLDSGAWPPRRGADRRRALVPRALRVHDREGRSSRLSPVSRSSRSTVPSASRRSSGSAFPASFHSRAGCTRPCTAAGSGRCASSPASAPPRRPTSASATCSTTARRGSRPRSTCPR